jgi:GNAT superfamily N-acetyltransferase
VATFGRLTLALHPPSFVDDGFGGTGRTKRMEPSSVLSASGLPAGGSSAAPFAMNRQDTEVVEIAYLADCVHVIPQLVEWVYAEWGREGLTRAGIKEEYESFCNKDRIPLSLVALVDTDPVGMVSLKLREMTIHRDKPYWLGGLFVVPNRRNKGIGSSLVQRAVDEARRLRLSDLYLHTSDHPTLYARFGFVEFERREYKGELVTIMRKGDKPKCLG